jgi:hypothetical protein
MSGIGWQEIAAGAVVLAAAAWLFRKARRAHRERVACAHCPVPKIPRPFFSTAPQRAHGAGAGAGAAPARDTSPRESRAT